MEPITAAEQRVAARLGRAMAEAAAVMSIEDYVILQERIMWELSDLKDCWNFSGRWSLSLVGMIEAAERLEEAVKLAK